jgi:hypothetical protein
LCHPIYGDTNPIGIDQARILIAMAGLAHNLQRFA